MEKKIQNDIKEAMKAKDKVALAALRAVKSEILLAKTAEGKSGDITDADILKIIQKLVKQRDESAALYSEQKRQDLADDELAEAVILKKYLPEPMSDEELTKIVQGIIDQVGAKSMADMGKVMGVAGKKLAGKADGRAISTTVKKLLG